MNHYKFIIALLFSACTVLLNTLSAQISSIQFNADEKDAVNNQIMLDPGAPYNYGLIAVLILAIVVAVVLGMLWNNQLRHLNNRLEEKQNRLLKLFQEQSKDIVYRKEIEEQLLSHQKQLSGMISTLPGFVYRCFNDEHYTMKFISDGCEEVTGYTPEEFTDNHTISFASIIHPDDLELIKTIWDETLKDKIHFQHEYRIIHRSGNIRIVHERAHGTFSDDGELLYLDGFISDITQQKKDQQALIDSEQKYRLITSNTSDVIWVLNLNRGCFTFVSPSVYKLRGFTVEESLSQSLEDSLTPESMQLVQSKIAEGVKRLTEDPSVIFEHEITEIQQYCKNGDIIWVEVATQLQFNGQGEIEITGVSRNIDGRKKMEGAIQYKNQMQQLLATISTDFISASQQNFTKKLHRAIKLAGEFFEMDRAYIFCYSHDNILYCPAHEWCAEGVNPSYETIQNMAFSDAPWWNEQIHENEPIYIPNIEEMPPEASREKSEFLQQNIKTLICFPILINGILSGLVGFDAVKRPIAITSEQMLSMQLITNLISDTLERIKAETAREESEKLSRETAARYQAFIDASNTGAWEYNKDNGNVWYSSNYFKMLGYNINNFDFTSPATSSNIWRTLIHPDDYENTITHLQEYVKEPQGIYEQTFRMKHADGSDVWILSRGRNLTDQTGRPGAVLVGTHIDITEQKIAEETILTKNKELETFLYVASHDLRSPLINIQGFGMKIQTQMRKITEHLTSGDAGHEAMEEIKKSFLDVIPRSLSIIFSNVEKMNDLINGLLAISRTGRMKMSVGLCNMDELMEKIIKSHWFQLEEAKVDLHLSLLPPCYGDANILSQLFSNLIDNAIKYKKPDQPLQLKIEGLKSNSQVIYSIRDNGLGISEKNQQKIWDVFFRVDPGSQQKGEGIGLNLASRIVEKHKGKIWVKSTEGEGSTFFVQLSGVEFSG
jgi:PAS domain S-box-containing protein